MPSTQSYKCPLCEYVLDPFDPECPRCQGKGLPENAAPQATPDKTLPPAVALPGAVSEVGASPPASAPTPPYGGGPVLNPVSELPATSGRSWGGLGAVVVVVLLALAGFGGYRYWISTPQYSLLQVKNSFNAHDLPRFEEFVAIDPCADSLADDLFKMVSDKMNQPAPLADGETRDPAREAIGRQFMQGMMAGFKAVLTKALKDNTRKIVAEGLKDDSGAQSGANEMWESTKTKLEDKEFTYQGIGKIEVTGEECMVKLNFYSDKTNQLYPIQIQMHRNQGHWQIMKWANAPTFFERIGASFN